MRPLVALAATVVFLAGCGSGEDADRQGSSGSSSSEMSGAAEGSDNEERRQPQFTPAPPLSETPSDGTDPGVDGLLARHGLSGLDSTQVVNALDRMPVADRPTTLSASVRGDSVVLGEGDEELTLALPQDRFYLAVAPYSGQTHACVDHAPTACLGELRGADVEVEVRTDDGATLLQSQRRTFDNGFVGLWLRRDVEGTVTVRYDGTSGSAPFSTRDGAPTCLTTLRLA